MKITCAICVQQVERWDSSELVDLWSKRIGGNLGGVTSCIATGVRACDKCVKDDHAPHGVIQEAILVALRKWRAENQRGELFAS